jgi:hypothetical protein
VFVSSDGHSIRSTDSISALGLGVDGIDLSANVPAEVSVSLPVNLDVDIGAAATDSNGEKCRLCDSHSSVRSPICFAAASEKLVIICCYFIFCVILIVIH